MARQKDRRGRLALVGALAAAALGLDARPAQAWTRARVETAEAHLDLRDSGQTLVSLALGIRVAGGWLSRFELTGLDPGLVLDPEKPPFVLCEDGRKLTPEIKVRDEGRVIISFPDKMQAPHRGLHQLALAYLTTLVPSEPRARDAIELSWSLPAWQVELRQSDIWVNAPLGATFAADAEPEVALERERLDRGSRTLLHFHRARLPRTVVFSAQLELPSTAASAIRAARPKGAHARPQALYVAALVLSLAWLKRRAALVTGSRLGARPLPLLALGPRMRAGLMLALAALGGFCYAARPNLGLALLASVVTLGLYRGFGRTTEVSEARGLHPRALALFGGASWLDATTPLGFGLLGSAYSLSLQRLVLGAEPGLWLEALLLVTPFWLTATRLHVPAPFPETANATSPHS